MKSFAEQVHEFKTALVLAQWRKHNCNATSAAKTLGMGRMAFNRWLYRALGTKQEP